MKFNGLLLLFITICLLLNLNKSTKISNANISSSILANRMNIATNKKTETKYQTKKTETSNSSSRRTLKIKRLLNEYTKDFQSLKNLMNTKFLEVSLIIYCVSYRMKTKN